MKAYIEENQLQSPTPMPYIQQYEQLAFGMFVHLGLYSGLAQGEWTYQIHGVSKYDYEALQSRFQFESFDEIVQTASNAGCRYICLTTRHHDGFSLYDTKGLSEYDVMHTPTGRDLISEFVSACRKAGISPFFYHTTLDWRHPDFDQNFDRYLDYLYKSVELLCTNYGKIGGFWFDGNWSKPNADWNEDALYRMIRQYQPEAVIINNTGLQARGERGSSEELDVLTFERGIPAPLDQCGWKKYMAGEMCETLCDHWGLADDINYKPVKQLIEELCDCRKVGANFLLNVGPNMDGTLSHMQKGIMSCIGRWIKSYGKAIYQGRPYQMSTGNRDFLLRDQWDKNVLYYFHFDAGMEMSESNVMLEAEDKRNISFGQFYNKVLSAVWMDNNECVEYVQKDDQLFIYPRGYQYGTSLCVRVAEIHV